MSKPKSQLKESLRALAEVAIIDLPAAATLRTFKRDTSNELSQAGWKAYDAATAVVTDLTNRAYANKRVAKIGARVIEGALKYQQFTDALSGAFFAALWPSVGLPMASDIEALRREVTALREETRNAAYANAFEKVETEAESAREEAVRNAALGARIHPDFENESWVGWHSLPAVEVRNRVRS